MEIPVDEVVAAILDDPVSAIGGEDVRWIGLLGSVTGDAKGVLDGDLAGLLVQHFALDHESLADMREIEIGVERRAAPDATGFNAAVIGW